MSTVFSELPEATQLQVMSAYIGGAVSSLAALARKFDVTLASLEYQSHANGWATIRRRVFDDGVRQSHAQAAAHIAALNTNNLSTLAKLSQAQDERADMVLDDVEESGAAVDDILQKVSQISDVSNKVMAGVGPVSGAGMVMNPGEPAVEGAKSKVYGEDGKEEHVPSNVIKSARELTQVVVKGIAASFTKERQEKAEEEAGTAPGEAAATPPQQATPAPPPVSGFTPTGGAPIGPSLV